MIVQSTFCPRLISAQLCRDPGGGGKKEGALDGMNGGISVQGVALSSLSGDCDTLPGS